MHSNVADILCIYPCCFRITSKLLLNLLIYIFIYSFECVKCSARILLNSDRTTQIICVPLNFVAVPHSAFGPLFSSSLTPYTTANDHFFRAGMLREKNWQ